jgi:hypothetical protein
MRKAGVFELMQEMPEEFELEELIEKLIFKEKIELALLQVSEGKTVSHERVKEIVNSWHS